MKRRGMICTGYRPKTGRPVDEHGNLLLSYSFAPASANGRPSDFGSENRGSTPRAGTKRGMVERPIDKQGELL
jgi:hypothetical protein